MLSIKKNLLFIFYIYKIIMDNKTITAERDYLSKERDRLEKKIEKLEKELDEKQKIWNKQDGKWASIVNQLKDRIDELIHN